MKKFRTNKNFYLVLAFVLTVFGHIAFAGEAFENNLIKMDVSENSLGGVRVNIYTSKPYSDVVSVNKKSDSEYVILMPETSNSMMTSPVVKSPSGVVKNIDVKTQQYGNKVKGYTKIIISTNKSVEITPHVQSVGSKITEKDYNELLSQVAKKAPAAKPAQVVVKKPVVATKTEVKPVQSAKKEVAKTVQKPIVIAGKQKLTEQKPLPKAEIKPQVAKQSQPQTQKNEQKVEQKVAQKPVQKTVQKVAQAPVQKPVVIQKQSVQPKPQVTQTKPQTPAVKVQPQPQVKPQVQEKVAAIPQNVSTTQPVQTVHVPTEENTPATVKTPVAQVPVVATQNPIQKFTHSVKNMFDHFVNNNNIYTVAGVALIPLIALFLLMRIVRKAVGKFKQQKNEFMKNLQESPQGVTDYSEKIDENMSWREKFKAYTDMSNKSSEPEATSESDLDSALPSSQELDELFGGEAFMDETPTEAVEEEQIFEEPEQELAEEEFIEPQIEEPVNIEVESELFEQEEPVAQDVSIPVSSLDEFDVNMEGIDEEEFSIEELFGEEEIYPENFEEPIQEVTQEFYVSYETEQIFEELEEEDEEEDELVKSEFSIDDEKGFYLVDFEDTTALVGHIADEIFVLKKFDEKINAPLQARVDEKKGNSTNYMTRVGNFKALVEVTPQNMNLLIEL